MRLQTNYEWTLEEVDEHGDIIDSDFADTLTFDISNLQGKDLGLVRTEGNEQEGVVSIYWAYVKDGKLPEYFSDASGNTVGYKVPKKYHTEFNNLKY